MLALSNLTPRSCQKLLSSGEILQKIEALEASIAATDSEIAGLQAEALHSGGGISISEMRGGTFGMQPTKKGLKLDQEGHKILETNNASAAGIRKEMSMPEESFFESCPLYTSVEESPFVRFDLHRNEAVKHHMKARLNIS